MSSGKFHRCPECGRLLIYGQICICGHKTNGQNMEPTS